MRKILDGLPGGWELYADVGVRPFSIFLIHADGRRLEPKQFALDSGDAQAMYRALKLEEDRIGRIIYGAEHRVDWMVIWAARVVIGDFLNRKNTPESQQKADDLLHQETEQAVLREQRERVRLWD